MTATPEAPVVLNQPQLLEFAAVVFRDAVERTGVTLTFAAFTAPLDTEALRTVVYAIDAQLDEYFAAYFAKDLAARLAALSRIRTLLLTD